MFNIMIPLLRETTKRATQLEGPQEIIGLLEARANGVNLVDQILNTDNAVLAKCLLDDSVIGQGSPGLVDLPVTTLVDQFPNTLQVGIPVNTDKRFSSCWFQDRNYDSDQPTERKR